MKTFFSQRKRFRYGSPAATVILVIVMLSGTVISCTSSGQVPLTVRQQQERQARADTMKTEDIVVDQPEPEFDEEQLRRMEEEHREMAVAMEADINKRINDALTHFMHAQTAYFIGNNEQALIEIQKALKLHETADFHALKGAVCYRLGLTDQSVDHWRRAVELDPGVVSDIYPGLKHWYEQYQLNL